MNAMLFRPIELLAALVPKPRVNLTRYHGVFAPNSAHRAWVTPCGRGKDGKREPAQPAQEDTPTERRAAMTWAQRLKRVFKIDIETCRACGGAVRIIACIEEAALIEKILAHLDKKDTPHLSGRVPQGRAPPTFG